MEFPLSKREMQILKEIIEKFGQNPNNIYIVIDMKEFLKHKEIMDFLKENGFVQEKQVQVTDRYKFSLKPSYTLLTDSDVINDWIKDKNEKAKRPSKREWKVAIFSSVFGAITGLIIGILSNDMVLLAIKELLKK